MSNWWIRCAKRKGNAIPRVGFAAGCKRRRKYYLRLLLLKHIRNWSYDVLE
jgi:hypothetical protein